MGVRLTPKERPKVVHVPAVQLGVIGTMYEMTVDQLASELVFFDGVVTKLEAKGIHERIVSVSRRRREELRWELVYRFQQQNGG